MKMSDGRNGVGKSLAHLAPEWLRPYYLSGEGDQIFPIQLDINYPVSTFSPRPSDLEVTLAWNRVDKMLSPLKET